MAGKRYVFQTALGTLHDSVLTLFAADGQTVLAQNDDLAPGNLASRIAWQAPAAGTYYLAVAAYPGSGIGSYSLQVSAINSPPVLSAVADQTLAARAARCWSASRAGTRTATRSATRPRPSTPSGMVAVSVSGNLLSVRPAASFTGRFQVQFSASDGLATATSSFWVTVAAGVNQPSSLGLGVQLSQAAASMPAQAASVDQAIASESWGDSFAADRRLDLRAWSFSMPC